MAGKIIDEDVLKLTVQNLTQLIADHVFEEEEYTPEEVDALFDVESPEKLAYYESLINPDLVSENRLWSSKTISDKLQQLQLDCNSYADEIATRNLTTEIITATSEVTKENVLYLILSDSSTNTYEQYMLIGGTATPLGSTKIDLSDVYTKSEIDTKLNTKANDNEVLKLDNILTTAGSETNDTVYSAKLTKTELDGKVDKTSILTANGTSVTDYQVYSAKVINTELDKKANMDKIAHEVDTSYMSGGILNVMSIKQSLGVGCYEILGQGGSGQGSIRLDIWQLVSGVTAFSCCITDTAGVRGICSNETISTTVDVGTSYFATTNKIIKIF